MDRELHPERLRIRPMERADIPAVVAIERASFRGGWPATAFERELGNNRLARYFVLERLAGEDAEVVGFAGMWLMVDEAHVVTVAVPPAERRRGYGRALVQALLEAAAREGMDAATLEVRVSNEAARALYRAYGFWEVGARTRYYDDGEDAVIMTTEPLASEPYRRKLAALGEELARRFPALELLLPEAAAS